MAPKDEGRRSDPILRFNLCQDISEIRLASRLSSNAAMAFEPLFCWVLS